MMAKTNDLFGVISTNDAEELLVELANFNPPSIEDPSVRRFFLRWGKAFPEYKLDVRKDSLLFYDLLASRIVPHPAIPGFRHGGSRTPGLAPALRVAWSARTYREQEWLATNVRRYYNEARLDRLAMAAPSHAPKADMGLLRVQRAMGHLDTRAWEGKPIEVQRPYDVLPPPTPLDVSLQHFLHILRQGHALICENENCGTPYFLTTKAGQKFCSEPCALPAKREAKLKWWRKYGAKQRKENQAKKERSK
jgi:hypothetical protein